MQWNDLVSKDAVIDAVDKHTFETDKGLCLDEDISIILEDLPSAQPERKKGHWIFLKNGNAICSECGFEQVSAYDFENWDNFCHHCGADMRGEK